MKLPERKIRVLVVDDSTFIRNAISSMLTKSSDIEVVGCAREAEEAFEKVKTLHPDVMTLDIEMPGMNGLQVLEVLMKENPFPIIMVSSLTEDSAKETLQALDLGAVDFISKQLNGSVLDISNIEQELTEKVITAFRAARKFHNYRPTSKRNSKLSKSIPKGSTFASSLVAESEFHARGNSPHALVVIGSSTGGPKALQDVLGELPATFSPAVLIVQHMPKFFTKPFSERLNEICHLSVREAGDGDLLKSGEVLVAPGGQHLSLVRRGNHEVGVRVSKEPTHLIYRPSVDVAMESAANFYGVTLIGVILTGMGNDGEQGMKAVKRVGGRTVVQDEASSMVYGMPKAIVDAGTADVVVPLTQIIPQVVIAAEGVFV